MIPLFDTKAIKNKLHRDMKERIQRNYNPPLRPIPFKSTIIPQQKTEEPEGDLELENFLNDTLNNLTQGHKAPDIIRYPQSIRVSSMMHQLRRLQRKHISQSDTNWNIAIPRKKGGREAALIAMDLLTSFRTDKAQNLNNFRSIYTPTIIIFGLKSDTSIGINLKPSIDWYIGLVAYLNDPLLRHPSFYQFLGMTPNFITNFVRSRRLVEVVAKGFRYDLKEKLLEPSSIIQGAPSIAWKMISRLYNNETKKEWLRDVKKEYGWTFGNLRKGDLRFQPINKTFFPE